MAKRGQLNTKRPPSAEHAMMTRAEARAFQRRWRLVNEAEIAELRATPVELKLRQMVAISQMASAMGWFDSDQRDVEFARRRWKRLRKACGV